MGIFLNCDNFSLCLRSIIIHLTVSYNDENVISKSVFKCERTRSVTESIVCGFTKQTKTNCELWKYRDSNYLTSFSFTNDPSQFTNISPQLNFTSPPFHNQGFVYLKCQYFGQGHIKHLPEEYFVYDQTISDPGHGFDPLGVKISYESSLMRQGLSHFLKLSKQHGSFFHPSDFVFRGTRCPSQLNCHDIITLFHSSPLFSTKKPTSNKLPHPPPVFQLKGQFCPRTVSSSPNQNTCSLLYDQITNILGKLWVQSEEWKWLFDGLTEWKLSLYHYLVSLFQRSERQEKRHHRKGTNMNEGLLNLYKPLKRGRSMNSLSQRVFTSLELQDQQLFSPIKIENSSLGSCHRSRDIKRLRFPFPVAIFTVQLGGSIPTYFYLWKVDPTLTDEKNWQKSETLSSRCRSQTVKRLTRGELNELKNLTSRLSKWDQKLVFRGFDYGSGRQTSESSLTKSGRRELDHLLKTGDYETIGRDINKEFGDPGKFKEFWGCLGKVIEDFEIEAEERRKNDVGYSPMCFSIPHLVLKVLEKFLEINGFPLSEDKIPHEQTVRTSFEPRRRTNATNSFKGLFNIKLLSQRRDLRQQNDLSFYCHKLWKNIRLFSGKFSQKLGDHKSKVRTLLLSVDDKSTLKIGEDDCLTSQIRQKNSYTPNGLQTHSLDHDVGFSKMKLIFSLHQKVEHNPDNLSHVTREDVSYTLHDNVSSPSSPLFHCRNLDQLLNKDFPEDLGMLVIFSDGGHDHNTEYRSVRKYDFTSFLLSNSDCFVHTRCAGGQSAVNYVETSMSIVNLALNGHSTVRRPLKTPGHEMYFRKTENKLKKLQTRVSQDKKFHDEIRTVLKDTSENIHKSMSYLRNHEKRFTRLEVPTLFPHTEPPKHPDSLFPPNVQEILKKFGLYGNNDLKLGEENDLLKKYLETHSNFTSHSNTFWKCNVPTCEFCSPINSPLEVFEEFHEIFCVNPVLVTDSKDERYFSYDLTIKHNSRFLPNYPKSSKYKFKRPFPFNQDNICGHVLCSSCGLYRVVFKDPKCEINTSEFFRDLQTLNFRCKSIIHPDGDQFCVDRQKDCESPIGSNFYSTFVLKGGRPNFKQMKPPCYCCGKTLPEDIIHEYKLHSDKFNKVLPTCRTIGKSCPRNQLLPWSQGTSKKTSGVHYLKKMKRQKIKNRKTSDLKPSPPLSQNTLSFPSVSMKKPPT